MAIFPHPLRDHFDSPEDEWTYFTGLVSVHLKDVQEHAGVDPEAGCEYMKTMSTSDKITLHHIAYHCEEMSKALHQASHELLRLDLNIQARMEKEGLHDESNSPFIH